MDDDASAGRAAQRGHEWRLYWTFDFPVLVSVHASLFLVIQVVAALQGSSVWGGVGPLLFWLVWNGWRARPGAEDRPDWRTEGRQHVSGVWVVGRPPGREVAPLEQQVAPSTPAPEPAGDVERTSRAPVVWALVIVSVDATLVAVISLTRLLPVWSLALAVGLLALHLHLLLLVARRSRARRALAG